MDVNNLSPIKKIGVNLLFSFNQNFQRRLKNPFIIYFWNKWGLKHFVELLINDSDSNLKTEFEVYYIILKPLFLAKDMNEQLEEAQKLSPGFDIRKLIQLGDFAKAQELATTEEQKQLIAKLNVKPLNLQQIENLSELDKFKNG